MKDGRVVAIHVTDKESTPLVAIDECTVVKGAGIEGDRYAAKAGTFSRKPGDGREVTLIELEALEALERDYGIALSPHETRRNILTQGVALNHLVGRTFKVGAVVLRGTRLCEPCGHLEKLTRAGVREGLIHRGGLRADVVEGGRIRVGDAIVQD